MASLKVTELGEYLREQRQGAKLSLRQLAEVAGVSNPYLSQVERGLRKPSAEVLQQIAKGLRISAEVLYVRAGILDERADRENLEVEAAVLADPHLTERQRQVLLDIYATFRSQDDRETARDVAKAVTARSAPVKKTARPARPRTPRASATTSRSTSQAKAPAKGAAAPQTSRTTTGRQ